MTILEQSWYGNSLADWTLALTIAAGTGVTLYLLRVFAARRLAAWARHTETLLDDVLADLVARTHLLFLLVLGIALGAQFIELPARPTRILNSLAMIALLLQAALWGNRAIALWLDRSLRRPHAADRVGATTLRVTGFVARVTLWSVLVLMVLDNLGFNITALVASLGIGGVAVALAVQNILGDMFASLSIALDKPFEIGDFIIVDDCLGTVEYIGIKTTRVRALSGEQIVLSNAGLLNSRIRNFKRMAERRVQFRFGVIYATPTAQVERIPEMVRAIIEQQPNTRFDRTHFKEYGDSALVFEVVYYVQDPDYNAYMDIQQSINLALLRRFRAEGIEFAYPTRTLHVQPVMPAAAVHSGGNP
jgi:small-conductance mechanosensitive channel